MFQQSNSTGKCKSKSIRRIAECLSCPKLTNKDYERPQPVKIAQLLGLTHGENSKSVQKDSVRKRIQPERLGAPSTLKSTQKKKRTSVYSVVPNTNVRRNLNFGVSGAPKGNQSTQTNIPKLLAKKSLFVPPSTIKPKQLRKSLHTANIQSGTDVPKELLNISISSATSRKNRKTRGLETVTVLAQKIGTMETLKCSTQTGRNKLTSGIENLSKDSQNATLVAFQNNTDMEGQSSEMIMVKKETIICLESTLKKLLKQSEENTTSIKSTLSLITNLLTGNSEINKTINCDELMKDNSIMLDKEVQVNTFCKSPTKEQLTPNKRNKIITNEIKTPTEINENKENENFNTPIITKMGDGNKIITNEIKTLTEINENKENENFNTPIITKMDDRNKIITNKIKTLTEINENKENKTSTAQRIFIGSDDSFLQLENQLNITYANYTEICNEACYSTIQKICTPVIPKQRSLREYMALKASLNFLQTPDSKRFRSLCQINDTNNSDFNVTTISSKLLTDLNNLYSESPGSD